MREGLTSDDPVIADLDADLLTLGLEKATALGGTRRIAAVDKLAARLGGAAAAASMGKAVVAGTSLLSPEARKKLVDASLADLESSKDPAMVFARDLLPAVKEQRGRIRVLNEKLFTNRALFARGMVAWKGEELYPDANFTLRATFGRVAGYTDARGKVIPFTTYFGDMFTLASARGNTGDFALPGKLQAWRQKVGDSVFNAKYGRLPVNFVSTNDITGGNSGSATLNGKLEIVGLIFDGNKEAMAGDWVYDESAGRALSTDIRFALTVAREVHGAAWVVEELLNPAPLLKTAGQGPKNR